jgi:hypothetical protein
MLTIPRAYWAHTQGLLTATESAPDTHPLYYFSPAHSENLHRSYHKYAALTSETIHTPTIDTASWTPPPYKAHYANKTFQFDTVVLNKFTFEWSEPPINYLDLPTIDTLMRYLYPRPTLYVRMTSKDPRIVDLQSEGNLTLDEWDLLKTFSHVTTIQEIQGPSYNETLLRAMATASNFVSVQGGGHSLTLYFGGTNISLVRQCGGLQSGFYNWVHLLGGANHIMTRNYNDLLQAVKENI